MISRVLIPAAAFAVFAVIGAGPSQALTAKECSVKYKAAKADGTLNGLSWNDFRKKECAGAEDTTSDAKPAATAGASGAVFPKAVDPKYAKESAGRARMHTCLDQYKANKGSNANGGMKWIQKGGGYYSKCNTALKS
jgi:hypothetical protein